MLLLPCFQLLDADKWVHSSPPFLLTFRLLAVSFNEHYTPRSTCCLRNHRGFPTCRRTLLVGLTSEGNLNSPAFPSHSRFPFRCFLLSSLDFAPASEMNTLALTRGWGL